MLDGALFPYGYQPEATLPDDAIEAATLTRPVLMDAGSPRAAIVLVTMTARAPGGIGNSAPVPLVAADALNADIAVTRAHTPTTATVLMQSGSTAWQEVAQNLPRFAWPTRALRIDGGGSNSIRNPRGIGGLVGTIGSGGGLPTNYVRATAGGLTWQLLGTGTDSGIEYNRFRLSGTASGTTAALDFETTTGITISPSQSVTGTFFIRQFAAPNPPNAYSSRIVGRTAAGAAVAGNAFQATNFSVGSDWVRNERTETLTSDGTLARVTTGVRFVQTNGGTYDYTVDIGFPTAEVTSTLNRPAILPVSGGTSATSRGADVPIWTPDAFPRRGCIVIRGTLDAAAGASALGLLQIDDATNNNRLVARVAAGGLQPEMLVVSGGSTVATLTPSGSLAAGVRFVALIAWSPGGVRFGTSAGGVSSAVIAMPPGVTRALLGHCNAAGTLPMGGEMLADFYPVWPSVAEATALLSG